MNNSSFLQNMRGIVGLFAIMALILSFSGCGPKEHAGHAGGRVGAGDTVPPNSRAFDMMKAGEPYEKYMPVQMEAVAQLRGGHPQSDAIGILVQTGHFLMRHGHYTDALEYMQEASDSARVRRERGRVDGAMARMHVNLSALYSRFGLFDEALAESDNAIRISVMESSVYAPDIWRMRGAIFTEMMKGAENKAALADSVLYCLRMAYSHIPEADEDLQELHRRRCRFELLCLYKHKNSYVVK